LEETLFQRKEPELLDRIISPFGKRMTAEQAEHGKHQAAKDSITPYRFHRILRTGRCISATWWEKRRDNQFIAPEQCYTAADEYTGFSCMYMSCRLSAVDIRLATAHDLFASSGSITPAMACRKES